MSNKLKSDRIHDLLPSLLNSRNDINWKGVIDAIGQEDDKLAQLVADVRDQFFVKTASRPYLDTLAANNNISRPKLIGINDTTFRQYIPILSYQPKQVKKIIDELLNVFFLQDATTAFLMSSTFSPFNITDGWSLQLKVDGIYDENIIFTAAEFTSISGAQIDEVVASYNRQAKYSFAINYYDSISEQSYIRIFTNTIGSNGSLQIEGGLANIALQLNGFLTVAGAGTNTQWTVTKVGQTTTFAHTGGASPGISQLQIGDIFLSTISGNIGSFIITSVSVSADSFQFLNLFSTPGTYTQISALQTKFLRPNKITSFTVPKRAITWETIPGQISVEMPATPSIMHRQQQGGFFINGSSGVMLSRDSDTSLTVDNASGFLSTGSFIIQPVNAITSKLISNNTPTTVTTSSNGRLISNFQKYTYTDRTVLSTTGAVTAGSTQITAASVAGLTVGNTIFATGFPEESVITNILGSVVTSSNPSTITMPSEAIIFGGNQLHGISPTLPTISALSELTLSSLSKSGGVVTCVVANSYIPEQSVIINGSSGILALSTTGNTTISSPTLTGLASTATVAPGQIVAGTGIPVGTKVDHLISGTSVVLTNNATANGVGITITFSENTNGTFIIQSATTSQFTFNALGLNGSATTPGTSIVETTQLASSTSTIKITTAMNSTDTGIVGPYVWDPDAPFVLSSAIATTSDPITAGKVVRLLTVSNNSLPDGQGFVVFDYGLNTQEGPVTYFYKAASNILAIDPSYIFQQNHLVGTNVVALSHKGPHTMSTTAAEYPPYVIDPGQARLILQDLIKSVTSAGIFVDFLIKFPQQLYGFLQVYD